MGIQTLSPLEHATIKVQYVNPPKEGKKKGSVRDTEGDYYGVWIDKLATFEPGGSYEITFRETNGYRDVVAVKPVVQQQKAPNDYTVVRTAAPHEKHSAPANGYYRPTSPRDAERMFVCSILNAFIQTGRIENEGQALARAVNTLREVWGTTFGNDDLTAG
jgi:hypothetical protein